MIVSYAAAIMVLIANIVIAITNAAPQHARIANIISYNIFASFLTFTMLSVITA